jgi:6-phosphogluconolactonase
MAAPGSTFVYVGTYTHSLGHVQAKGEGIYVFTLDQATGALQPVSVATGVYNPSFLTVDPSKRFLYATSEAKPFGEVYAFEIDPATGGLTFLNSQSSHGGDPCHLMADATSSLLIVVNHEDGVVAEYPIHPDGSLGPASDIARHVGSSIDPVNQKGPHAHSVNIDRTNRFALVCDKGIDKVMVYRLDREPGKLVPNDPPSVTERPGSAPRHLAFHPSGRFAWAINEIASTMTGFSFDAETGTLVEIETMPTLPADFTDRNSTADVRVHPNGRFLYGSNRGHDSIASYAIDQETGKLTFLAHTSTQGKVPRNFNIDPTGTLLLAANQNTDTVVAFAIDATSGKLTPTGAVSAVPTPVCIHFVER